MAHEFFKPQMYVYYNPHGNTIFDMSMPVAG